ncbi:MAG TPA: cytochrome c biogenesis protein ResB [Candidatus Bathyarchaeia archaeon]|nr:cytochrome c biogenesis protein ResB [Candidatus Bathyarchaeia archaeon]
MIGTRRPAATFITYRFATAIVAFLFGASAAGWISTELVPADFLEREDIYRKTWGGTVAKLVGLLHLYDPFHSLWYRLILALFFTVLLLCVVTRWRRLALASWRPSIPTEPKEVVSAPNAFEISWRLLDSGEAGARDPIVHYAERYGRAEAVDAEGLGERFARLAGVFRRRGFAILSREGPSGIAFAAFSGRWRSPGSMLFHVGILIITIGGVIGSYGGWREMLFVREGSSVPFPHDSTLSLHVDRFEIVTTRDLEVKDFISTISVARAGGITVAAGAVKVNHPMKAAGRRIYQSEFTVDEHTFRMARVAYSLRENGAHGTIDLAPGIPASVGDSSITVTAVRYLPDFRMSPDGPFTASAFPSNPALEVRVVYAGETEHGWLFLYHPDFNKSFAAPVHLGLDRCEPLYYTGLEVSANPGASVLFAGFAAATLGLLLMYLSNPRVVKGVCGAEKLVVAGTEYRWKASFEREFAAIRAAIQDEFGPRG